MIVVRPKAAMVFVAGFLLVVLGIILSFARFSSVATNAGIVSIVAGIATMRFFNSRRMLFDRSKLTADEAARLDAAERRRPLKWWEMAIYAIAATLTVAVLVCAKFGYFTDLLTYTFAAALVAAVAVYIVRRIF